jgi:hypothetical protein
MSRDGQGRSRDENWVRLETQRDALAKTLRSLDSVIISDQVLRAGFHPHRGPGRAILEVLVARHRGRHPRPLVPDVDRETVVEVTQALGVEPDLEPEPAHA